jgi:dTDP-D-glucose 4,6-dehydratase
LCTQIVVLDKLDYCASVKNLESVIDQPNVKVGQETDDDDDDDDDDDFEPVTSHNTPLDGVVSACCMVAVYI